MRLGIDYGTTRTRVVAALSGNYPPISFQTYRGDLQDWYPSLIAVRGQEALFGLNAQAVLFETDWELLPSLKRRLDQGRPQERLRIGDLEYALEEWLTYFFEALRQDLLHCSNLSIRPDEPLEAMVGVPAQASGTQRFLTMEALRKAGFKVLGMVNEPVAAGIEYAHQYRGAGLSRNREHVAIYDLGGGTFDAAMISMAGQEHEVVASDGVSRLGGDDFDDLLLELGLELAPDVAAQFDRCEQQRRLSELCREAKERINPHSRRIVLDWSVLLPGTPELFVEVPKFYARCQPLIDQTIASLTGIMARIPEGEEDILDSLACVYLVGGACELPILARVLRERFGRRVRRSPYPSIATAIGLALAADESSNYRWSDLVNRHFGVWREDEHGNRVRFDPIFMRNTRLPRQNQPPIEIRRRYHPVHNIGHFRFAECSQLDEHGEPTGNILTSDEIRFPFDPALITKAHLEDVPIERNLTPLEVEAEECFECDSNGIIQVTMTQLPLQYRRVFRIH